MAIGTGQVLGAAGDLFGGIMSGIGQFQAASGYEDAAQFSKQSAALTHTSTQIQEAQKARETSMVLGAQQTAIASSGFLAAGSALDIIRDSAQQASLSKQLVANQGLITELGFKSAAKTYEAQADAARMAGTGDIVGGVFSAASKLIGI